MIYNENTIQRVYEANIREIQRQLQNLPVYCGGEPNFPGLAGWIFEQTIQHCLRRELEEMNLDVEIEEQIISEAANIDLLIGNTAIDVNPGRPFSEEDISKYVNNQIEAKRRNWSYIFIILYENDSESTIVDALGKENTIFLQNHNGEWEHFVNTITDRLK
ncbi:MAG: hypothetical protein ABFD50_11360 [Smithella sp.]